MNLKKEKLSSMVSFLLGVSWAIAAVGALSAITEYRELGIVGAITSAFVWALPGLFLVASMEYMMSGFARLEEARKQTHLLEKILERLDDSDGDREG